MAWATLPSDRDASWALRLTDVPCFARHVANIDPKTEVPPAGILPRLKRAKPYVYSDAEINALLAAALALPPANGLRRWTYHYLFGLIAVIIRDISLSRQEAPGKVGALPSQPVRTSGGGLGRLNLQNLAGTCDRDRPGLHRLRDLANEIDVQEPVLQPCALYHNVVGKLKATLKRPLGDALVEHVASLFLFVFFAADRQRVFLRFDRKISVGKSSDCDRDAKSVLAVPL